MLPVENEALFEQRVQAALTLLAIHAPHHLRRLSTHVTYLFIARVRGRGGIQVLAPICLLRLSPAYLFRASAEEVALDLVAVVTALRYGAAGRKARATLPNRRVRGIVRERLWVAERLPASAHLVAHWRAVASQLAAESRSDQADA